MNFFKKTIGIMLILLLLSLHVSEIKLAHRILFCEKADAATMSIRKHAPEFLAPPEKKIPVEIKEPVEAIGKTKTNKWLWIGLGVLAAGVLAGAAGGGGGDSGGGGGGGDDTGTIIISGPAP